MSIPLNVHTIEKLSATVTTTADPTGATPYFAVTALTDADPTDNWVAGAWDGTYDATTQKVTALTPTIGASGAGIEVSTAGTYQLWCKWTVGSEVIVRKVDLLNVS